MHLHNRRLFLVIALWLCTALFSLGQGQTAPAQPPQQEQGQAAVESGPDPMSVPLQPEDLVVPSNAALSSVAPPPAPVITANAGASPAPGAAAPNAPANAATPNTIAKNTTPQPPAANSQQPAQTLQQGRNGVFTLKKEVDEVILHATVVDAHQHLVTNLPQNAFTVYEDGQQQPITSFHQEDVPVAVGILVDDSGSMREKRAAVTQAALNFVRSSNPDDRVFVVNFNDQPYLDADFTSSIPKLKEALDNIEAKGETALYDAVVASADHIMKQPGVQHKLDKKVLLVITDGWDNASAESLEQAVRRVQVEGGPTIYTIGLLDEDSKKKGKRALKALAEETGGVFFQLDPNNLSEVDSVTQQIAHDIRNQYTIGYKKNPQAPPGYRTIKVVAKASGYHDLVVRTRSGYYPGQEKDETVAASGKPQ